jgi:4-hydroxy-2-oxoheptanedioate aldolase
MPKRVNKVIELLEQGQPVYCVHPNELSFSGGQQMAKTWADWVRVDMEHSGFDMPNLEAFMRGLVEGGPTNSGHRTPTVTVELPFGGYSEAVIRANAWMIQLVLGIGVHGVLLCHAETPAAIKAFIESCRYAFHTHSVGNGLAQGQRGAGGEFIAADVWGLSILEYQEKADVWPLNPDGEIVMGIKVESNNATSRAEKLTMVPGLCFAEWGPADMTASFGYMGRHFRPFPEDVLEARAKVMSAVKKAGLHFLHSTYRDDIIDLINEGVMLCDPHGDDLEEIAMIGRAFTGYADTG